MRLRHLPYKTLMDALDGAAGSGGRLVNLDWGGDPTAADPVETVLPWSTVREGALRAAARLHDEGVRSGSFVLLVLPNGPPFISAFLGTLLLGAIPVPQPYPAPFDDPDALLWNFERIRERTGDAFIMLHAPLAERWQDHDRLRAFRRLSEPPTTGALLPDALQGARDPAATALVQFTSGSTGDPRGVVLSHANLLANASAIGMGSGMGPSDVGISWLPLCHDMGLIGALLSCMAHHASLVLMSPFEFVMDPLRWLWAFTRYGGTISTAPNFGYALCVRTRRSAVDESTLQLGTWRVAMCGAEPVSAENLGRFASRWEARGFRREALFPVYGLAEASLAVSFPRPGDPLHVDHVDRNALSDARRAIVSPPEMPWTVPLVGLGNAVAGHRVRIVDDDGRIRADREVGEICVKGPSVTAGYLRDRDATDAILHGGWLRTGDLGYTADGHLFVCGRKKDVIIFRGRKYYPQDLERAAQDVDGVRKGNVVAFGEMDPGGGVERVTLVLETRAEGDEADALGRDVRARVQECTGVPVERVVLLQPGELPKTPSGKVRRNQCRLTWGVAQS